MNRRKEIQRYRLLIAASLVILIATFAMLIMQVRSLRKAEAQSRATVSANLDLHLLEIVENAKWDILDHVNHVFHSIRQQRIRERNLPSIERAFTRSSKRYPEVDDFYVVFFEPKAESNTWRTYEFIRPDINDPNVERFEGNPVGKLVENTTSSESLMRAWNTIEKNDQTTLYSAFDPITNEASDSKQYFFHTVYELDRLKRVEPLKQIGLLVFSAKPEEFPSPGYFEKLVQEHSSKEKPSESILGELEYAIENNSGSSTNLLVSMQNKAIRTRGFEPSERLFPGLTFGIATPNFESNSFFEESTQLGILFGVLAGSLLIIGLLLTWWATRREMKLAQMKSDFLANISHELKTPITAIRAFGDLIHSGRTNDAKRVIEYGGLIKTESDRLMSLINNVLELSRLERGIQSYRMEKEDICSVVSETVEFFKHSPEASGCLFELSIPSYRIETVVNRSSIRQAVINLLSNAVKYSSSQSASDNVSVNINVSASKNEVFIEIGDTGIGISPSEQTEIFKSFHRSSNLEIQEKGGIGLGLAIVNEIVKAHSGKVAVDSKIGKGSKFIIQLPLLTNISESNGQSAIVIVEESVNGTYISN